MGAIAQATALLLTVACPNACPQQHQSALKLVNRGGYKIARQITAESNGTEDIGRARLREIRAGG